MPQAVAATQATDNLNTDNIVVMVPDPGGGLSAIVSEENLYYFDQEIPLIGNAINTARQLRTEEISAEMEITGKALRAMEVPHILKYPSTTSNLIIV